MPNQAWDLVSKGIIDPAKVVRALGRGLGCGPFPYNGSHGGRSAWPDAAGASRSRSPSSRYGYGSLSPAFAAAVGIPDMKGRATRCRFNCPRVSNSCRWLLRWGCDEARQPACGRRMTRHGIRRNRAHILVYGALSVKIARMALLAVTLVAVAAFAPSPQPKRRAAKSRRLLFAIGIDALGAAQPLGLLGQRDWPPHAPPFLPSRRCARPVRPKTG
jgi:hypothetical protein